jgi:hypothetical protein
MADQNNKTTRTKIALSALTKYFHVNIKKYVTFNDPKDTGSRGNVKNSGIVKV